MDIFQKRPAQMWKMSSGGENMSADSASRVVCECLSRAWLVVMAVQAGWWAGRWADWWKGLQ
jgi:hypothetical protein